MKQKSAALSALRYAGVYVSYEIGSGFSTGQEIKQFFTAYGGWGVAGALAAMALLAWLGATLLAAGYDLREKNGRVSLYRFYMGEYWGVLFQWATLFILFSTLVVMLSGAGAVLGEYYGLPTRAGSVLMAALVFATFALGLRRLLDIMSFIGPATILITLSVGVGTLLQNGAGLAGGLQTAQTLGMPRAAPWWWLSAVLYASFPMVGGLHFFGAVGGTVGSRRQAVLGGALGGFLLMTTAMILNLAMLSLAGETAFLAVPNLYMAHRLSPQLGRLFSALIFCEVYSTAAPLLWTVANGIRPEKKGRGGFFAVGCVLLLLALFCGQLPFEVLVGSIYPYTGYLGLVILICVAGKRIKERIAPHNAILQLKDKRFRAPGRRDKTWAGIGRANARPARLSAPTRRRHE